MKRYVIALLTASLMALSVNGTAVALTINYGTITESNYIRTEITEYDAGGNFVQHVADNDLLDTYWSRSRIDNGQMEFAEISLEVELHRRDFGDTEGTFIDSVFWDAAAESIYQNHDFMQYGAYSVDVDVDFSVSSPQTTNGQVEFNFFLEFESNTNPPVQTYFKIYDQNNQLVYDGGEDSGYFTILLDLGMQHRMSLGMSFEESRWNSGGHSYVADYGLQYSLGDIHPVPVPTTMLLFGSGLVGLVSTRIRKRRR